MSDKNSPKDQFLFMICVYTINLGTTKNNKSNPLRGRSSCYVNLTFNTSNSLITQIFQIPLPHLITFLSMIISPLTFTTAVQCFKTKTLI